MPKGVYKHTHLPWNKNKRGYKLRMKISKKGKHYSSKTEFKKGMIPWNKKEPIRKECPRCQKIFYVKPSLNRIKYCSKNCSNIGKPKCKICGKEISYKTKLGACRNCFRKIKPPKRGKESPSWRGGGHRNKHNSDWKYKQWRMAIFIRDNFICLICGKIGGYLEVHHIKSWAKHKKLRFNLGNGITLCKKCHKEIHKNYEL